MSFKDSKLTQVAAIASIVGVLVAVYQFFVPSVATPQQISSNNAQATGQGNAIVGGQNNAVNNINVSNNSINNGLSPEECKSFLEQNLDKILPSMHEAICPEVQSIAQDVAGGDDRLRQASEFLKENKISEALPLFKANADEAAKNADQASSEDAKNAREKAVSKYRRLGIIASLADSKLALEAFEEALDRDPDDMVSLVGSAGILQSTYGELDKAKERLTRALKFSKTPEVIYCALICLGDIERQRQHTSYFRALKFYQKGRATASGQLTIYGSANAMWKFYLVYANEAIGDIELKRSHFLAARKYYREAHEIMSRLEESDKSKAIWRRGLSISYQKIGDLQLAQNDREGAIESYRQSLGIIESLANDDGVNVQWQSDRVDVLSKLANVYKRYGDNEKAQDYSLQAAQALREHRSTNDQFKRNMVP